MLGAIGGALEPLTKPWNWEQVGTMTPDEAAEYFTAIIEAYSRSECEAGGVPTPFWDEGQDVDDEETPATQTWYGEVDDPEGEADEISFVENVGIWAITGFIAYSGQIGAAIFFHSIAPSFVLAWHRGDLGEIWRVIVDSAEYGQVDTGSASVNDVVQMPVMAGGGEHDILLVKVG